jgi:hypothetical protein
MSTIKTISEFKQNKTKEELNNIFSKKITINEKIKGHRFSVIKKGNVLLFFGKKSNAPLSTLDRVMSDLYESSIHFILKQNKNVFENNVRYGFYFPMKTDNNSKKPKNNLFLTDITFGNNIIIESLVLNTVAKKLNVSSAPTLFSGFLDPIQREKIITNDLTIDFLLNEILFFKNIFYDNLDTVIFRIEDSKYTYLRLEESKKQNVKKQNSNKYEFIILDILDFFEKENLKEINLQHTNKDLRYVELISEMFNRFLRFNKNYLQTNVIKKPEFLINSGNITKRYITNQITNKFIQDSDLEYLFRIFLTIFKGKIKKRGILTDDDIQRFRTVTNTINFCVTNNQIKFNNVEKIFLKK